MTTRNRTWGAINSPNQGSYAASGTDGKSEVVNGVTRTKWNNFTMTRWEETRKSGLLNNNSPYWITGISPKSLIGANETLTLQSRLSERVKGHSFNLAVTTAEAKKTSSMVLGAVNSIGGALYDLRKGRVTDALRRLKVPDSRQRPLKSKDIAGRWLEMQYGWLPLMSDVYEASKAYEALTQGPRKSRVTVSINRNGTLNYSVSPAAYPMMGPIQDSLRIIYEMTEELSVPRSLGLTDPLTVAWELIPYSFVVDWFIPVGTYLENLNVIPKLRGRFLTTRFTRLSGSAQVKTSTGLGGIKIPPQLHVSYVTLTRTYSTSLSVPKPEFESLSDAFSGKRILNAIALVSQRVLK